MCHLLLLYSNDIKKRLLLKSFDVSDVSLDTPSSLEITRSEREDWETERNLVVGWATPSSHKHIMSGRKERETVRECVRVCVWERARESVFHKHTIKHWTLTQALLKTSCHLTGLPCLTEYTNINVHYTHAQRERESLCLWCSKWPEKQIL